MSENNDDAPVKSFDLVTNELVKNALVKDKGKEAELVSFEVKPFTNKGDNYTSVVTEVLVKYRLKGTESDASYVAKLNPLRPMSSFNEVLEDMFLKETNIFSTIVGGMNEQLEKISLPLLKTPKLYSHCLEKGKEGFLTENLRAQGFKMYDRRKGMDLSHSTLVMKELGRFHASSVLYDETLFPKTIPETFDFKEAWFDVDSESFNIFDKMMASQIESSCSSLRNAGPKYEKCEKWLTERKSEMSKCFLYGFKPKESFSILAHGDCWTNNILFKYDEHNMPIDIRFVDLQCSRRASPASDLNYFFFTSLNGDLRTTKREVLIQFYYDSFGEIFERSGKSVPFSMEELKEEMKSGNLFGLSCAILVLPAILAEGDEIWDVDNCKEDEYDEFLKVARDKYEKMSQRAAFKDRFLEVFDEMIDDKLFD